MLHRKSVFVTILISYMLLLAIPFAVGGIGYRIAESILARNVDRANFAMLEQIQQMMDSRMKEIDRITIQLAMNPDVVWMLSNTESAHSQVQMHTLDLMKQLSSLINANDFLHSLFLYFANRDTIVTPTMRADRGLYFERIQRFNNDLEELLTERHFKLFRPFDRVAENGAGKREIAYIQSLPLDEEKNPRGSLVLLINEQTIADLLKRTDWDGHGFSYILDANGDVLAAASDIPKLSPDMTDRIAAKPEGSFAAELESSRMIVSYATGKNGWKYVTVVPYEVIMAPISRLKTVFFLLLVVGLGIGLTAACWMAYRNYRPVRDMVRVIVHRKSDAPPAATNEFDMIRNTLNRSFETEKSLKETIEKQAPVIQSDFVTRLIRGNVDILSLDNETAAFLHIPLDRGHYRVVLIEIEDGSPFMKAETEREWALVRFTLTNLSEELLRDNGFIVEMERNRLAILEFADKRAVDASARDTWIFELKQTALERFNISMTVSISSVQEKPTRIGTCYYEAVLALNRRIVAGPGSVLYYEGTYDPDRAMYHYPIEFEVQFMNYAKTGDYENASSLLRHIYEDHFASGKLAPDMGRLLFFDILSSLLKTMQLTNLENRLSAFCPDPFSFFDHCATGADMLERIMGLLSRICSAINEERTDQGARLYSEMVQYVDRYYHDCNLSLNMIADHFSITPQYVSTFFKKYSGGNLSDYIAEVRIAKAKTMLADKTLTINDISKKVGYANHVSFGRLFKRLEGITPGQYRDVRGSSS